LGSVVMWLCFFVFSIIVFFIPGTYSIAVNVYITNIILYVFFMVAFLLIAIIFVIVHWSKVVMQRKSGDTGSASGSQSHHQSTDRKTTGSQIIHMKPINSSASVEINDAHDIEMIHSIDQIGDFVAE